MFQEMLFITINLVNLKQLHFNLSQIALMHTCMKQPRYI